MYQKIKQYLTTNTSAQQTVIKNTFWLLLAEGVSKGLNIILMFRLAKLISVELFGQWNVINAVAGVSIVMVDLGLQQIYIRDILRSKHNIADHLVHSALIKFLLLLIVGAAVWAGSTYISSLHFLQGPLMIYVVYMGIYNINEFLRSAFRAQEKMESEAKIKLASGVVLLCIVGYTYMSYTPLDLMHITTGYLVSIIVQCAMTLRYLDHTGVLTRSARSRTEIKIPYIREIALSGLYLGLTQLCMYAYFQIDQVILHSMGYSHEVGIYSGMRRIVQLLFFVGSTFIFAYMPHYLKHHTGSDKNSALSRIVLVFWGLVIVVFGLSGKRIIPLMYTPEYLSGYRILMVMLVSLLPMLLIMAQQQEAISHHREKYLVKIFALGLVCNLVMNYICIPLYGVTGALIAGLSTQVVVWVCMKYNIVLKKL